MPFQAYLHDNRLLIVVHTMRLPLYELLEFCISHKKGKNKQVTGGKGSDLGVVKLMHFSHRCKPSGS